MFNQVTFAQSSLGKALNKPSKYNHPSEKTDTENINERDQNQIWVVYSDRDGNISYSDSINKIVFKSFGFLSKFYVVGESQVRVHIVKDKGYITGYGFSNKAIDFGWANKETMLLWNRSLFSHSTYSTEKCFIVDNDNTSINIEQGLFYLDPNLLRGKIGGVNTFSPFYIYKITDKAVLLGLKPEINAYGQLMLSGWVSNTRIIKWTSRSAIEPNFDSIAAFERRQNNIKTTFCRSKSGAKRLAEGKFINNDSIIWDNDPYEIRWKMNQMRFPVLMYNSNEGIIEAIVYNSKGGNKPNVVSSKAFAPIMVDGLQNPLFNKVIYITKEELKDLTYIKNSYQSITNTSNIRSDIKWFLISLLEFKLGEELTTEKYENYSFREFRRVFYYLSEPRKMDSFKLEDLTDPSMISDEDFEIYYKNLKSQINQIGIIVDYIESEIGMQFQENEFYWIPEKLLK